MERKVKQSKYSKHKKSKYFKKRNCSSQENNDLVDAEKSLIHLKLCEGNNHLPFVEPFTYEAARMPLPQHQPKSYPFVLPSTSHTQLFCYSSPHGPVTSSVVNGTTFYYYHGNPNPTDFDHQTHPTPSPKCACFTQADASVAKDKTHSDRFSSINHSNRVNPPGSPNRRASFASISSTTSRSSSPFLSSIGSSNSARDSGLVSMTDDDASSIHEANHVETREDKLLLLVREAAEEILSDKNLSQDSYLLRQMKRNQEGYISIKLLGSSKQIRKITSSHNLLLLALQSSKKLEVNKSNTKVKRRVPLSSHLDARRTLSSLVLIDPKDINGIDDVTHKFKPYGEMAQIRIVRPGKPIPPYLKGYVNAIPKLGMAQSSCEVVPHCNQVKQFDDQLNVLCVIVEFEEEAAVIKAYRDFSAMHKETSVTLLGPKVKRSMTPATISNSAHVNSDAEPTKHIHDQHASTHSKVAVARLNSGDSTDSRDSGISPDELHSSMEVLNTT